VTQHTTLVTPTPSASSADEPKGAANHEAAANCNTLKFHHKINLGNKVF
jgi:hypothetical protein